MDNMQFDLELATSKAERQFKAFISNAEKEMKRLKAQVDKTYTSVGKKGEQDAAMREFVRNTRQRKKEMDQAKKDSDAFFSGIASSAKSSNKEMDNAAKGFANSMRSRKKEMDKAQRDTEVFFTRVGQAARSSRREQDAALRSFAGAAKGVRTGTAAVTEDPLIASIQQMAAKDKATRAANIRHNQAEQAKLDRYNQRMAEKAGQARWKANEEVVAREQSNAEAIAKAYETAYKRIDRAAKNLSPTQQRIAAQMKSELKQMLGSSGVTPGMLRDFSSDRVDTLKGVGRGTKDLDKQVAAEKKAVDAIAGARIRGMSRIDNAEMLSNEMRQRLAAELAAELTAIEQQRAGKTKAILQSELIAAEQANAMRVKTARAAAAQAQRQSLANVTRMNKANMVMFGVQQSIEDFQFAGFRGISNNLAMMTSMMGGGTGLAAMAALAAVNLGTMAYSLSDAGKAADDAANRTQRLIDKYMSLRDVRQGLSQGMAGTDPLAIAAGGNEARQKARETRREMRDALANRNHDLEVLKKIKEARQAQSDIQRSQRQHGMEGGFGTGAEDMIEARERLATVLDELSQSTGGSVKSLADLQDGEQKFGGAADAASKKAAELAQQARNLVDLGAEEGRLQRFVETLKGLEDIDTSKLGDFGDASGNRATGDFAAGLRDKIDKNYEQSFKDRQEMDRDALAELQEAYTDALDARNFEEAGNIPDKIEQTLQQQVDDLEKLRDMNNAIIEAENERLTKIAMVADKEKEVRSELEAQIAVTKRRIAQQEEVIANLEKQKQASREGHEADKFGLQMNNIKRDADDQAKAIEKRAETMRDRIKSMMAADQNNPFLSPMHKAASQAYGEAWLRKIDRDEKKMMDKAKQKRLNRERSAYDQRESSLSTRAASELKKAQEAAGAGEFGKAESWLQKQRQTLEELRRLQMDQAMNLERRGEANAAGGRADQTQGQIDASFDKEMEMAKQKQAQDQAALTQMQASLEYLDALKSAIQDKKIISETDIASADETLAKLQRMLDLKQQIANTQLGADSPAGAAGVPARAAGGPVTGGSTYLVGENGPELFAAGSTGRIYNTHDTQGLMSMVSSIIAAGEHGGRQAVHNNTNFGTTNVNLVGGSSVQDLLRQSAMAAKQQRIRQS